MAGLGRFYCPETSADFAADPAALSYGWVFFAAIVGICAMLLPGISGGYLLNVLGMYIPVITALSVFFSGLAALRFDWEAFKLLAFLGLGIPLWRARLFPGDKLGA